MGLKRSGRVDAPLRAVLREVDADAGELVRELGWESPTGHVASEAEHRELTGAWREGEVLWCTTRSEVLRVCLRSWRVLGSWSHPLLYDVHSVQPAPEGDLILSLA